MSLSQALSSAVSGMRTTQAALSLVAGNVANAETPGYVRKTLDQAAIAANEYGSGVRAAGINRALDQYLQRQVRSENAGAGYATMRSQFYERLQQIYGDPSSSSGLSASFNNFTSALQTLSTSPDDYSARAGAITSARLLAQNLNGLTTRIQALRSDAEQGLADGVRAANAAMSRIAQINARIAALPESDLAISSLLDERDLHIDQLSQLMDIRVTIDQRNLASVFTTSGIQLTGTQAATLSFDAQGSLSASSLWSADPALRSVGTISLAGANGSGIDLLANKLIRSGELAAYVELRDVILPQAQAQLDEMAAALSELLSDRPVAGTPVTSGTQSGFDLDIGGLLQGNAVTLTVTDLPANAQRRITIVRVDQASALPLPDAATADPSDRVIGVDMSGGAAAVATQLGLILGKPQFSNPSGSLLRILDDGVSNTIRIDSVSARATVTSLTAGVSELPLFMDGALPYTGAWTPTHQSIGFAGRIAVNSNLAADPSRLVIFDTAPLTAAGDPTRPNFLLDRLLNATRTISPGAGIGTPGAPYSGPLPDYLRHMLSFQGDAASAAQNLMEGQAVVVDALKQRFSEQSGVNIDREMSNLLILQNAYGASARVVSVVKDMFDALLNI